MEFVDVPTGAVEARQGEYVLKASAVGSCVVITAYDRDTQTGAMAHVMLPGKGPVGKAIDIMTCGLNALRADTGNLEICLAGGGNVLKKEDDQICKANIASVIELLAKNNLYARAKAIGGILRRSVSLNTSSGLVTYTEGNSKEKILWKSGE